jgi:hypothetical protein
MLFFVKATNSRNNISRHIVQYTCVRTFGLFAYPKITVGVQLFIEGIAGHRQEVT